MLTEDIQALVHADLAGLSTLGALGGRHAVVAGEIGPRPGNGQVKGTV